MPGHSESQQRPPCQPKPAVPVGNGRTKELSRVANGLPDSHRVERGGVALSPHDRPQLGDNEICAASLNLIRFTQSPITFILRPPPPLSRPPGRSSTVGLAPIQRPGKLRGMCGTTFCLRCAALPGGFTGLTAFRRVALDSVTATHLVAYCQATGCAFL